MKDNEHRKYIINDREVPSCTQIVSLLDKPELIRWANYMGFKRINTTELLERKAEYGTYCHKQFETYFSDGILGVNSLYLSEVDHKELINKLKYIDECFERFNIKVIRNELPITGNTYGGTLDMLCYNKNKDCLMVFDLKTSKSVYNSHWIQLMGYCQLLKEVYDLPVEYIGVILISKPMKSKDLFNIRPVKECMRELNIFNNLRDIHYLINETNEIIKEKVGYEV